MSSSNPLLPREQVHAWSEAIGTESEGHSSAITRLLKEQRRLSRFVEENVVSMEGMSAGVAMYLVGVIVRMFDLAGGRLRKVAWDDVRAAEKRVGALVDQLLPIDDGFVARAREVPRAQAHILDEALYALFIRDQSADDGDEDGAAEEPLEPEEAFKVYLLMWVATEALDRNWQAPSSLEGEAEYAHKPVTDAEAAAV